MRLINFFTLCFFCFFSLLFFCCFSCFFSLFIQKPDSKHFPFFSILLHLSLLSSNVFFSHLLPILFWVSLFFNSLCSLPPMFSSTISHHLSLLSFQSILTSFAVNISAVSHNPTYRPVAILFFTDNSYDALIHSFNSNSHPIYNFLLLLKFDLNIRLNRLYKFEPPLSCIYLIIYYLLLRSSLNIRVYSIV